jgi:hypothetical protein
MVPLLVVGILILLLARLEARRQGALDRGGHAAELWVKSVAVIAKVEVEKCGS